MIKLATLGLMAFALSVVFSTRYVLAQTTTPTATPTVAATATPTPTGSVQGTTTSVPSGAPATGHGGM